MLLAGGLPPLRAQVPADSLYYQLVATYLQAQPGPYADTTVALPTLPLPPLPLDSSARAHLRIGVPRLQYERLAKKRYLRHLQLPISQGDSTQPAQLLHLRDTLDLLGLRAVRRQSAPPFRGENPTYAARWLRPVTFIAGSTVLILALFFIRTPA